MQKNKELQDLFNNYRNLSEDQLMQLLGLVIKQEKDKMRLSFPVSLEVNYEEVNEGCAGGDFSLKYNEEEKRHEYVIRLNGRDWYAQYLANRNKTINYKTMEFDSSMDSLYHLIAQVCHEMRHAYQTEVGSVRKDITDDNALIWLKEYLSITDGKFYKKNNSNMSREVDAFDYQFKEALEFIKTYTTIEIDNPRFFEDLKQQQERWNQEYVKPLNQLNFDVNGKKMSITDYFHQHITETFQKQGITPDMINNSILRYEFNSNGTKKTLEQLMQEKQKMIDSLDKTLSNYERQIERIERIYASIIQNDRELKLQKQQGKLNNTEYPLRSYLSQTNPQIEISSNYINYSQFQRISDEKSQTEKRKNPLVSDNKVIGELEETEVYDFETATSKTTRLETVESEKGIYTINSEIQRNGEQYSVTATMDILNEISKSREKATYTRDMIGNETYTYMENGKKEQMIKKTERGTIIDIYKDGQPYATYEYDENGKALEPMGTMEQLPEDYIEKCFRMPLPEYEEIQYQKTEQEIVSTQKLGKETLDMQQDIETLDNVEKQMEEQEFEINQSGEIIRKGRTGSRFDLGGTSSEYATQTLNEFMQNLDNGDLEDKSKKKKDDEFKVEKNDDDYVR